MSAEGEHQVDVVFSGHEHVYERMAPQNGVMYFVAGASGAVWAATLADNGPTGGFFRDGKPIAW